MREPRPAQEGRRAREFTLFVAGAAGRLLHTAALLTGEPVSRPAPAAEELLTCALSRTYAAWDRLRGDDPYERARREMALRFAHTARRHRRPRGGLLDRLSPRERLVLVLRLYEGVPEEQTAAQLGLPAERVHALCLHAVAELRSHRPRPAPSRHPGGPQPPSAARRTGPPQEPPAAPEPGPPPDFTPTSPAP
ncbi:sigma factor-like helix-turn-helix DNA-binding protein [Streptomyces angustmyceticus]|uniref:sigma factor-like helix-turn-helix DNA-binding protein n=1 Tax=Streptomyces angustmyceticus TaxID=285578 RepID=UPI003D8A41C7